MRTPALRILALALIACASPALAASFDARWEGSRLWVGPEYWSLRWQDWSVGDGQLRVESRPNRSCVVMTRPVVDGDGAFEVTTTLRGDAGVNVAAGLWAGVRGPVADAWQSDAAYGKYHVFAGVRPEGGLVLRGADFGKANATADAKLDVSKPMTLRLRVTRAGDAARLQLDASQADHPPASVALELPGGDVVGLWGVGTADLIGKGMPPGPDAPRWRFDALRADGALVAAHDDRTFGPIGWAQYTVSKNVLKLTALMVPVGDDDAQHVELLLERDGRFESAASEPIEALSRTATFRVERVEASKPMRYRLRYAWQGRDYTFDGTIRATPVGPVRVAVMSCDWGYAFPNAPLVAQVAREDPDLLVYAGDQIYEHFGLHGIERFPLERVTIDYLRKYALFGWLNRELLRDRPSVIIPDDHDLLQGNVWGDAGKPLSVEDWRRFNFQKGGYLEPAAWVNAMQRTQTWHLPDAVDPAPVEQGIGVYFGDFALGGVRFAILEDRKWKSGVRAYWPTQAQEPPDNKPVDQIAGLDVKALDPPGAELLGPRQEAFLERWASDEPDKIHVAISQTMFAKAHTHTGPPLRRIYIDFDTNGWPKTARDRAVRTLGKARAIHLAGDQHVGILAQLGADAWDDGPLAFMVPGTANGWPRAWWPEKPGDDRAAGAPDYAGRFLDEFGNRMTILAAANPEPGSNKLTSPESTPYAIAHAKGSGFGLVTLDPAAHTAQFEMIRFPDGGDAREQFEGFPQTFRLGETSWQRSSTTRPTAGAASIQPARRE